MSRPRKRAGFSQGIYEQSATQKERLGTVRELDDGRTFVYCLNGAGALAPGTVLGAVTTAGMTEDTVTVAHAIGTKLVTMTDSGGGTAADAFAGGRLVVRATRVGSDTQLAQMARLVSAAQAGKAPVQRLADRISAVFVPGIVTTSVEREITSCLERFASLIMAPKASFGMSSITRRTAPG
jgi:hypothetical protein